MRARVGAEKLCLCFEETLVPCLCSQHLALRNRESRSETSFRAVAASRNFGDDREKGSFWKTARHSFSRRERERERERARRSFSVVLSFVECFFRENVRPPRVRVPRAASQCETLARLFRTVTLSGDAGFLRYAWGIPVVLSLLPFSTNSYGSAGARGLAASRKNARKKSLRDARRL